MTAALAIFAFTFLAVSVTRLPWVRVDRPAAAFIGAVAMVLFGVLTFPEAVRTVDWDTIGLLLGMMVIIGALQQDGYTEAFATALFNRAKSPRQLLVGVIVFTGVASAFLVNDAVVLVATPLIVVFCRSRGLNPIPFLLAEAMASNIGSAATITGNPQNVLIGLRSDISFVRFSLLLLPVTVASMAVLAAVTGWMYRNELRRPLAAAERAPSSPASRAPLSIRPSLLVLVLVVAGFIASPWLGVELPLIALLGAAVTLGLSGHDPREIFKRVDWVLLLFFTGLFIVIGGAVQQGLFDGIIERVKLASDVTGIGSLHGVSLVLSQLISNVPLTILLLPIMESHGAGDLLWLSLASGATLAGNLTLIGAVANLIVAEGAAGQGVKISFLQFARLGLPVTVITMGLSVLFLWLEHALGFV